MSTSQLQARFLPVKESGITSIIRVQPAPGWAALKLGELWRFRELLYFLTWRDVKVRYKQTLLGAAWAILQPALTMLVFSLFFGRLAKVPSDDIPYPLFSLAALVPWTFFASGLGQSSNSLVGSANLIKKVYFPRLTIPIAAVLAGAVDFALALLLLFGMMLYYVLAVGTRGILPTAAMLWLPPFMLLALVTSLGVGLWLSALNVQFRDVRYVVPFLTQIWMFASPVAYSSSLVPIEWRTWYALNPMVGVVDGFRWALLGANRPSGLALAASSLAAGLLLVSGAFYFRRMEKTFADVV